VQEIAVMVPTIQPDNITSQFSLVEYKTNLGKKDIPITGHGGP
jgi:hypothetical protein